MRGFLRFKNNLELSTKFIKADLVSMMLAKLKLNHQTMNGINFLLKK